MALIKCNDCGKEVSDTSKTCIHCGCPIIKMIECPECKKEVQDTEKVCPHCGNKLGGNISITVSKPDLKKVNLSNKKTLFIVVGAIVLITLVIIIVLFSGSSKIDLQDVYDNVGCTSSYCEVASDGSYLEIDTNPYDFDDYSSSTAAGFVKDINLELGFSEALYTRMGKTRALDGTLTEENDNVKVSWTYHPDDGLEVVYTLK